MEKPNILIIVIDAFPFERCCGQNKTSLTPNIDNLVQNGVSFTQAISSANNTTGAYVSLLTASFPFKAAKNIDYYSKINLKAVNYLKILKNNEYNAYATIPDLTNIQNLFSEFDIEGYPYFGHGLHDGLGGKIIEKLELGKMNEPWCYLVHLMDAHKPISFPNQFDTEKFGKDEYDKAISSIDFWLGKILEKLNFEKTIIILTADHGDFIKSINRGDKFYSFEFKRMSKSASKIQKFVKLQFISFFYPYLIRSLSRTRNFYAKTCMAIKGIKLSPYERRSLSYSRATHKNFLFDEVIHIPLIITGFGIKSTKKISKQVRIVDIFPTIFEIIGLPSQKNVDGKSLIPLIEGREMKDLLAYFESSINARNPLKKSSYGIRTNKYKYFRKTTDRNNGAHLYDLENDSLEECNIISTNPKIVKEMEEKLLALLNKNQKTSEKEFIKNRLREIKDKLKMPKRS